MKEQLKQFYNSPNGLIPLRQYLKEQKDSNMAYVAMDRGKNKYYITKIRKWGVRMSFDKQEALPMSKISCEMLKVFLSNHVDFCSDKWIVEDITK